MISNRSAPNAAVVTPYLYYEDVARALTFLAAAFGFRRTGAQARRQGRVFHAAVAVGKGVVMLGTPPTAYRNPKRLGQATGCIVVDVPSVDTVFERAVRAGATVIDEPADTPFGTRRCGVADPEGHQWYFTQRVRRRARPGRRSAKGARKKRST